MRRWESRRFINGVFSTVRRRWLFILIIFGFMRFWDANKFKVHCPQLLYYARTRTNATHFLKELQFDGAVQNAVSFNGCVLLVVNSYTPEIRGPLPGSPNLKVSCLYGKHMRTMVISIDQGFVHCKHPPSSEHEHVTKKALTIEVDGIELASEALYGKFVWQKLAYSLTLPQDGKDVLVFAKGIIRSKKGSLPAGVQCVFGDKIKTKIVAACQENFRCKLPPLNMWSSLVGKRISLIIEGKVFPSIVTFNPGKNIPLDRSHGKVSAGTGISPLSHEERRELHELCLCTMIWNGAKFLTEWVIYHSHLGVKRFFLYDNNSDDDLSFVVQNLQGYNVSRHLWPWMKTQEAGFSHCAVRASSECRWIMFTDLDEFIFPKQFLDPGENRKPPLHALIEHYDAKYKGHLGQLKISCFDFGPSGLSTLPRSGQMVNYICRMNSPKRVKSIVRLEAISESYCNHVHHFEVKKGFVSTRAEKTGVVIHHYKYQVWEDFKQKFHHRAATYVSDWHENKDMDSFDRTPGLGTEAIEPPWWTHQFCEVYDRGLRDYVLRTFKSRRGHLLWE